MKTAIIIGNGKIGSAIAHHLWFQHNYSVVNTDRRVLDLSDLYEVGCFFQNIGNTEIDCLVNAAGTYGAIGKVGDVTPEAWAEAIAVNLVGVYACCHHAIKRMKPGSHIINLAGAGGATEAIDNVSGYSCAKSGIDRLTLTLAKEYPELCVNLISPGPMLSKMQNDLLLAGRVRGGSSYDTIRRIADTGEGAVPVENTLRVVDTLLAINPTGKWYAARLFATEPAAA